MVARKFLVVFVICLLMLVSIPPVESSEEKPDLVIEDISKEQIGHSIVPIYIYYCRVKNNGNRIVTETIEVFVRVNRLLFGYFPIVLGRTYHGEGIIEKGLAPGETIDIKFNCGRFFPSYFAYIFSGIYLARAEVDPGYNIDESNETNNNYCERFWSLIGP